MNVEEAPRKLGSLGDTDSGTCRDGGLRDAREKLERWRIEWAAVVGTGQAERLGHTAGACAEEVEVVVTSARSHLFEPVSRLEGAHEDCCRLPLLAADEAETPVDPVRSVNVGSPRWPEQRSRSFGRAAEPMARGFVLVVRLDLDDPAADTVDEQGCPNHLGCDVNRRPGEVERKMPRELDRPR
jgi:hypothetical protein